MILSQDDLLFLAELIEDEGNQRENHYHFYEVKLANSRYVKEGTGSMNNAIAVPQYS